jgi:release factor glutamine methyltransferase
MDPPCVGQLVRSKEFCRRQIRCRQAGTVGRVEAATYDDLVLRLRAAGCVFAEEEARLLLEAASGSRDGRGATSSTTGGGRLEELVARRVAGEPLEHVLGWVDFAGVRVALEPGVFIPRQRTSYVVDLAAAVVPPDGVVVDLCCGSGALGLALARRHPGIELHAADIDPVAVACARRNLDPVGAQVHHGDLATPLPDRLRSGVDVLVANVPYVPSAAIALMPPESREHEPRSTVDGGADGLDLLRRLAELAPAWLAPRGVVFVETGADQTGPAADELRAAGLRTALHRDEERSATVMSGRRDQGPS